MPLRQTVKNYNGFSLIELLIAIVIISISMLALLTSMLTSMQTNQQNDVRNDAIRLLNQTSEILLALPLDDEELVSAATHTRALGDATQDAKGFPVPRRTIRNYQHNFNIVWEVTSLSSQLKQIAVTVTYSVRGQNYSNSMVVFKHLTI